MDYLMETLEDKLMMKTVLVLVELYLMVAYFLPYHWLIVDVAVEL
jgi:hypothetical protein